MPDRKDSASDPLVSDAQLERARRLRQRLAEKAAGRDETPRTPHDFTDEAAEQRRRAEQDASKDGAKD